MMIGFAAVRWADAFPPSVATSRAAATAASPAATTAILDRLIESPSWLHALRRPFSHGPLRIRGLSGFHEAVEGRLERHLDAVPPRLDVFQHRRVVPASAPRREDVHLPRVLLQLDAGRGGDALALLDQLEDQ